MDTGMHKRERKHEGQTKKTEYRSGEVLIAEMK